MALEVAFADGFDHYPLSVAAGTELGIRSIWQTVGSETPTLSFRAGLNGRGKTLRVQATGTAASQAMRVVPTHTKLSLHWGLRYINIDNNATTFRGELISFGDGLNAAQFLLKTHPTGRLGLYRGATLLGETALAMIPDVAYRLSLAADLDLGTAKMWIKGDIANGFDLAGLDLKNTANNDVQTVSLWSADSAAGSDDQDYEVDDMLYGIGEAVQIPELELITDVPVSDVLKEWTPTSGTDNFEMVNEIPPNTADDNSSTVVGNTDLQGIPALPTSPDSIFCMSQILAARKEEAGTRTFCAVTRPLAAEHDGVNQNLTTSNEWYYQHYLQNPETLAAWLVAERAAAAFGYKDVA